MTKFEIIKIFDEWDNKEGCRGYFTLVMKVMNRHPEYMLKLERMNIQTREELWDLIKYGIPN